MARELGNHTFAAEATASTGDGDIPLVIEGASGQTAKLLVVQDSAGVELMSISAAGAISTAVGITVTGDLTLSASDIITDTTTGTKIGTAITQLIGFYNATPVDRPSAYTQTFSTADKTHASRTAADLATTAATQSTPWGFATQAQAEAIATQFNALRVDVADTAALLNSVVDDLQELGLVG